MTTTVLLAGATGSLGRRIAAHLLESDDVALRLLVRTPEPEDDDKSSLLRDLVGRGATLAVGDLADPHALDAAVAGADVVVSAVQGGKDVILDGQFALARAASEAGVRRFVPSDFALDIWSAPEDAPMFAIRRDADAAIEALDLEVVHVLNGAFMDMLLDPHTAGVVDLDAGVGHYWGTGSDRFDVTLIEDVARFTALVAVDPEITAGRYAISGEQTSFEDIFATVEGVTGRPLERVQRGTADALRSAIDQAASPWAAIGAWYNLSMISTPAFAVIENDRYPGFHPTGFEAHLRTILTAD